MTEDNQELIVQTYRRGDLVVTNHGIGQILRVCVQGIEVEYVTEDDEMVRIIVAVYCMSHGETRRFESAYSLKGISPFKSWINPTFPTMIKTPLNQFD